MCVFKQSASGTNLEKELNSPSLDAVFSSKIVILGLFNVNE